jgi:DNA-binding IclR family transcriptional regulator
VDDREIRADMRCLAVPIHDADGRVVAAMSATDHAERMVESRQTEVRDALQEASRALEYKVFPPGPSVMPPVSACLPHDMPLTAHG